MSWGLEFRRLLQAEDGIRDDLVTGVQTCALPIYWTFARTERRDIFATDVEEFITLVNKKLIEDIK